MNSIYMQKAIDIAWKFQFLTYPNPAVGACVVRDGQILSVEAHKEAGLPHAEVNALKSAYLTAYPNSTLRNLENSSEIHTFLIQNHNDFFKTCEIFVTLEPCNHIGRTPACANLLSQIGIKKVYIGSLDSNDKASGGLETLKNNNIDVEIGILKQKSDQLLMPFTVWQCSNNFRFFKLAIREDGTYDGGYITSQKSLNLVHEIRTKIDLLVVSGNTVRTDRPILDSRFAINPLKSSNVFIFSKFKEFDKTIPLFSVPKREVYIENNFDNINNYISKFVMIEGGLKLLEILKNNIDMVMLFVSHNYKVKKQFEIKSLGFKIVHSYMINELDEVFFLIK